MLPLTGPGGGPDLTSTFAATGNTILGYFGTVLPVVLGVFAVLFGVGLTIKVFKSLTH